MIVMGFNFDKINVEKFSSNFENFKLNTNIDVRDIKEAETNFFKTKDRLVEVKFVYTLDYQENLAKIEIGGAILLSMSSKESEEVLKQWKEKNIAAEFKLSLFNTIFRKSNLKAIQLEEDLNLPIHIPLPQLGKTKQKTDKKESPIDS